MGELHFQRPFSLPPPPLPPLHPPSSSRDDAVPPPSSPRDDPPAPPPPPPPHPFDPSRMIGIIRRKALIKELAAAYHAECLTYCQELLELQKKIDEATIYRHKNPRGTEEGNDETFKTHEENPLGAGKK
ncbi:hypothetical protein STAS_00149 [Striga asiatica]|uniref:Uncharacterized protein n=1 Tax=Striga asiatica TaxID=4170 RepID=A0A5A7NVN8_STRAF|nr:hypothetical protein STAS_00149 [Striga asiatica]